MQTLTSGTIAGAGSFRCQHCDYVLTLLGSDTLTACPRCGGEDFARASLFRAGRPAGGRFERKDTLARRRIVGGSTRDDTLAERRAMGGGAVGAPASGHRLTERRAGWSSEHEDTIAEHRSPDAISEAKREASLAAARGRIEIPGEYLVYEEGGEWRTVALTREWTRIGRSLAADVRFDDPTVSRRHALIVRQPDGVRVLDDRSLNGVFVNGARVEGRTLQDGDEILVGRYRLSFLSVAAQPDAPPA